MLFFDEADSLLSGAWGWARPAPPRINQNRNALMQELDRFDGVVIMTTNLFGNYDPALLRRIHATSSSGCPTLDAPGPVRAPPAEPRAREADLASSPPKRRGCRGGDILNVCLNAIHAGHRRPDPARWRVTATHLLDEIAKVKAAHSDHRTPFCREATQSA